MGRFRLERELGSGGHGVVWRATDTLLGEQVAVKVLKPELLSSTEAKERIKREVVLARRVQHPGICRVNDLHEIDGGLVISMQLVDGIDLDVIMEESRLPLGRALRIIDGMADAVAAAHQANVIHRDLKPSNIAIVGDTQVVIMDFGIASASDLKGLTEPGVVIGTLRYVPPETLQTGAATAHADQYALGIIAWGLLAGRLPWPRPNSAMELIAAIERGPPDLRAVSDPPVPVAIVAVIERAMARKPGDRFGTVRDFQLALHAACARDPATAALRLGKERTGAVSVPIRARDNTDSVPTVSRPAPIEGTQIVRRGSSLPSDHVTDDAGLPSSSSPSSARGLPRAALGAAIGLVAVVCVGVGVGVLMPTAAPATANPPPSPAGLPPVDTAAGATGGAVPMVAAPVGPTLDGATAQLADATARARALGLRRGDVAAWDIAAADAAAAIKRGEPVAASTAASHAASAVAAVVVDQRFINAKLARFNARSDDVLRKRPELRDQVKGAALAVARSMGKGDAGATNRALNAAFGILDKP
jgi:serine/threonine protein kinase